MIDSSHICEILISLSVSLSPFFKAVWALGNIAGDSPEYRDRVLECDALSYLLLQLGEGSKLSMRRNATWTLSNFCRWVKLFNLTS